MLPASALLTLLALGVHAPAAVPARIDTIPANPTAIPLAPPAAASDRSADSLLILRLQQRIATGDSLARLVADTLLGTRDSAARLGKALARSDSLQRAETRRKLELGDSLTLFKRPDSLTLLIDTLAVLTPTLACDSTFLRHTIEQAALRAGYSLRLRPQLPGLRNYTPLRVWMDGTPDSAWLKLDLNGKIVTEGRSIEDSSSVHRLERGALRSLFGNTVLPPEAPEPWHWSLRAAALLSVLLASTLVTLCLW